MTMRWTGKVKAAVFASVIAFTAAVMVAAVFAVVVIAFIGQSVKFMHPGDASAGDSAGWMIVILSPILIGLDVLIGCVSGTLAFRMSYDRLRSLA